MPPSEIEQLRAALAELSARVAQLERLVADLHPSPPVTRTTVPVAPPSHGVGVKVINRVGALTLAIGVIFFFKYAVDNRWIGAAGRVFIGLAAGFFLIAAGESLRRRSQQVFSQGVAGCGLATVFISIYAAFAFYHLVPQSAGFVALVITCAGAVILSIAYGAVSIAALGFTGAVLTAMLLTAPEGAIGPAVFFPYLLIVCATATLIAAREHWTLLGPLVTGLVLIGGLTLINPRYPDAFVLFAVCAAAIQFIAAARVSSGSLRDSFYYGGHAALVLGLMRAVAIWGSNYTAPAERANFVSEAESFLLAVYGGALLIIAMTRKTRADRILGGFLLALVVAKLYVWDVWELTRFYLISAFVALGILLLGASFLYARFRQPRV